MNGYADVGSSLPTDIEMASLVSSVQDLLPDLGAGFIQECLKWVRFLLHMGNVSSLHKVFVCKQVIRRFNKNVLVQLWQFCGKLSSVKTSDNMKMVFLAASFVHRFGITL